MTPPLNGFEPKVRIADLAGAIRFAPGSEFTRLYLMRDFETLAERYPREFVKETGGNLAAMARELFVEKTATDVVCLQGLKVHCRTLVDDLTGSDPSPVLRLAVEAALFCYLEHWVLTEDYSRRPPDRETWDQARRREAAFNRYVKSLRLVEAVRRTPRPGRTSARILDINPPALPVASTRPV